MKKYIILLGVLIILSIVAWRVNDYNNPKNEFGEIVNTTTTNNTINTQKPIDDKKKIQLTYKDNKVGFSLQYPANIKINPTDMSSGLYINVKKIADINNIPNPGFPLGVSKNEVMIDNIKANTFMTLSKFEVCDIRFERTLVFDKDKTYQISITLKGDTDDLVSENSGYFKVDPENCGNSSVWNFDEQNNFFKELENGKGLFKTQKWFNEFDNIVKTIKIITPNSPESLIQGTWMSLDDANSVIKFDGNKKTDYYEGKKILEASYQLEKDNLIVKNMDDEDLQYKITTLSKNTLEMIHLSRGNTLKYKRLENQSEIQ